MHETKSESYYPGVARTHLYSFIAALAMSVALVVVWWSTQSTPPSVAVQRRITDLESTWRCDNGHRFAARGSLRSQSCPTCSANADIETTYDCPVHGARAAQIRLTCDDDGIERIAHISFRSGVWQAVKKSIHCPRCGRHMRPASLNPFAR